MRLKPVGGWAATRRPEVELRANDLACADIEDRQHHDSREDAGLLDHAAMRKLVMSPWQAGTHVDNLRGSGEGHSRHGNVPAGRASGVLEPLHATPHCSG